MQHRPEFTCGAAHEQLVTFRQLRYKSVCRRRQRLVVNQATDLGIPPALMQRYLASLPEKRAQVLAAWDGFVREPSPTQLQCLREVLHRLAGSSVMYGFDALGGELRAAMNLADDVLDGEGGDQRARLDRTMDNILQHWSADGRVEFG